MLLYGLEIKILMQLVSTYVRQYYEQYAHTKIIYVGGGVDYNSGPYNVTFPAGVTNVSFNVTIINDNVLENNEIFHLIIDSSSLPNGVAYGKINQVTVNILNMGGSGMYTVQCS